MRIEELIVMPCGSRCVSARQPIVSSSRQMVEVLGIPGNRPISGVGRGTSVHLPQENSQKRNSTRCSRPPQVGNMRFDASVDYPAAGYESDLTAFVVVDQLEERFRPTDRGHALLGQQGNQGKTCCRPFDSASAWASGLLAQSRSS